MLTIKKGLFVYSDSRIKTNVTSLGNPSTLLFKITPKIYNMIGQNNRRNKIGFIAQNVLEFYPELVNEKGDYLRVNYQGFIPVIINNIKEQNDKYLSLRERINKLKQKINE